MIFCSEKGYDMKDQQFFKSVMVGKHIPLLVLDQKWHRLYAIHGKPDQVKELEAQLNGLLARQGKLNTDLKELKKLKNNLMSDIMDHMEGAEDSMDASSREKKMEDNKRLIDDINDRLEKCEDELLEIPNEIAHTNDALMLETMDYCYDFLRVNQKEAKEIDDWIQQIRIDLKKNIIRKQNREINNKEMYSYLHDIFGAEILDMFDLKEESKVEEEEAKE